MTSMAYAPESGSDGTRKFIKKRMKKDNLFNSTAFAFKAGSNVAVFIVIGFLMLTIKTASKYKVY